mgnify:CR=1 FL=1
MQKRPTTSEKAGPLLPEILDRWSPRAFNPERILTESEKHSILEALRWGASSGNNQPWKLAWIDREDPKFDEFVSKALMAGNAVWAKNASAMAVVITETERDGEKLDRALYTTGLAAGQMLMQVQYVGLFSHHMSGIHTEEISKFLNLGESHVVNAVVAIGEIADASTLPENLAERELEPRERKQMEEIVIYGL